MTRLGSALVCCLAVACGGGAAQKDAGVEVGADAGSSDDAFDPPGFDLAGEPVVACVATAASGTGPVVIQAPGPVGPGQTAFLFGAGFGGATLSGGRLSDEDPGLPPRPADCMPVNAVALPVVQGSELSAKALVPSAWAPGLYAVVATTATGASAVTVLNRPRIDWIHAAPGGTLAPGGSVDVYGRGLGPRPHAWLVDAQGTKTELPYASTLNSDGYVATFSVPVLPVGAYTLYAHSQMGGAMGFSDGLAVTLATPTAWPTTVYAVKAGTGNDDTAFATAFAAAKAGGGGIVSIASGSYTLTAGLSIPPKTVVKSASGNRADVTITFDEPATPSFPYGFASDGYFSLESVTIASSTSARLVQCPTGANYLRDPEEGEPQYQPNPPCDEATIHDVSLTLTTLRDIVSNGTQTTTPSGTIMVVLHGDDCEISDSTLTNKGGSALTLAGMNRLVLARNTLVSGTTRVKANATMPIPNGTGGGGDIMYSLTRSAIVGNVVGPTPDLGSSATMGIEYRAEDLYIADNKTGPNLSNFGEGFSFDAPYYPDFYGIPKSSSGTTLVIPTILNAAGNSVAGGATGKWAANSALVGDGVIVVNGTGLGQFAEVASNLVTDGAGDTQLTLDRAFAIPLDATSVISISSNKSKVVFARNDFHDCAVGAQLYAGGYDFIVDGTTGATMEGTYCNGNDTMSNRSTTAGDVQRRFSGCYFNQFINNTLTNQVDATYPWASPTAGAGVFEPYATGLVGVHLGMNSATLVPAQHGILAIGNVIRNNDVGELALGYDYEHDNNQLPKPVPEMGRDNLVELNTTKSVTTGIIVEPQFPVTLVRENVCSSGCTTATSNQTDAGTL